MSGTVHMKTSMLNTLLFIRSINQGPYLCSRSQKANERILAKIFIKGKDRKYFVNKTPPLRLSVRNDSPTHIDHYRFREHYKK